MLKTLSPLLNADLLWVLAAMGHGDELALVDRNFPAWTVADQTRSRRLVRLDGSDMAAAAAAITSVLPLDTFVKTPIWHMDPVDEPGVVLPVHRAFLDICEAAEGRAMEFGKIPRHDFYLAAARCFAVVQTTESRPYACFILKKGVVLEPDAEPAEP